MNNPKDMEREEEKNKKNVFFTILLLSDKNPFALPVFNPLKMTDNTII